ncbi:transmembrane and ubiquitin-like domain-containing protein 1 [Ornithodoros turicata]|uniref:transmembrane and ubiquitin-like domain-containing protein 1 n=1 Tax=Ornithodoros turicata TaxID=34597 RepID=UPI00313A0D28
MPETWIEEGGSIVEGIGDEVLLFGSGFVALLVILLTWLYLSHFNSAVRSTQHSEILHPSQSNETNSERSPSTISPASEVQNENVVDGHIPSRQEDDLRPTTEPPHDEESDRAEENLTSVEEVQPEEQQEDDCTPEALRERRLEFYSRNNVRIADAESDSVADTRHHPTAATSADTAERRAAEDVLGSSRETRGQIMVRLKYLNDTERCVTGRQDESLGEFRRRHFAEELASQRVVRLIFNGAQLRNDTATLSSCGIQHGCVVHVHVSTMPATSSPAAQSPAEVDLNLGALMWALFATVLGMLWFAFLQIKELFNWTSITILVILSGFFCIGLYGQYHPSRQVPSSR